MTAQAPYNPDPYPMFAYYLNVDGKYHDPVKLEDRDALYKYLNQVVPQAIQSGLELLVTDNEDCCTFHVKHHRIIWPNDSHIPPGHEETS